MQLVFGIGAEAMSRSATSRTIRTILCATDFSAASEEAFRVACSLAAEHTARLIVVHVAPPEVPGLRMSESLVLHDDYVGAIEARLRPLQGRAPHVPMQFQIEVGHPSAKIIKLARAARADLIVIGAPRNHALPFPPSTSQEVVAFAPCAVAIVAPEQSQPTDESRHSHPDEERSHERAIDRQRQQQIV